MRNSVSEWTETMSGLGEKMSYWIWYKGDFERWHAMKQNFSRVERGLAWPAFWKSEGIRNRIALSKEYVLEEETSFTVHAHGLGYVLVNEDKYPFESAITCGPGKVRVTVHLGRLDALPSALVIGDVITSGPGWVSDDYAEKLPAGFSKLYTDPGQDPNAELIPVIDTPEIPEAIREAAGGSISGLGTGGMATKVHAADIARRMGTAVLIVNGQEPDIWPLPKMCAQICVHRG